LIPNIREIVLVKLQHTVKGKPVFLLGPSNHDSCLVQI
jgi:hypothetical protein